jgi:hypothetical protein
MTMANLNIEPAPLVIPRVHWNGTSRDELLKQLADARQAIHDALDALAKATPHGRDYYVISPEAITEARDAHFSRVNRLQEVVTELEQIADGVFAQKQRG